MFGNENDRPYEFKVDTASTATMAYVIGRLRVGDHGAVRRQRAVGPDEHRWRSPRRPARPSCARSSPAPMPPTWGRGRRMPARRMRYRDRLGRQDLALLYNVSAEFAYSLDQRSLAGPGAQRGVLLASPMRSWSPARSPARRRRCRDLEAVKKVLPDTPVLANTGVKHATVADVLQDRRRLHRRLVAEGRRRYLERRSIRSARRSSCGSPARREGLT